jgi:hypothetical protein
MGRTFLVAMLGFALTSHADAHDTWMTGRTVDADGGARLELQLTSGMGFPSPESAVGADRVERADVFLGDRQSKLKAAPAGPRSLALHSEPLSDGLALAAVVLEPRELELDAAQVEEYLAELDAGEEVRAAYARTGHWRERYRKTATALVRIGTRGGPVPEARPLGLPLELVALSDPSRLPPGAGLRACLYAGGKPMPGHRIGLVSANSPETPWLVTNSDGCADFELTLPGRHLLRAIVLKPARERGVDWVSEFTTLSFELPHYREAR